LCKWLHLAHCDDAYILFLSEFDHDWITDRISETPRMVGENTTIIADLGLDLSAFNLMLPWQQQAVQSSHDEEDAAGADPAATADTGQLSARFQRSLETVNQWKAQQSMKAKKGPMSLHGSIQAQAASTSAASQYRDRVTVDGRRAPADPPLTATTEAPVTEVRTEAGFEIASVFTNIWTQPAEH